MEKVNIYDKEGRFLRTQDRTAEKKEHEYTGSVHAYLIDEKGRILIQQRAEDKKENPNLWEVVGGGLQAGETPEEAIIREIIEETGININKDELTKMGNLVCEGYYVTAYIVKINSHSEIIPCIDEVKNLMFVNPKEIEELINCDRFFSSSYGLFQKYIENENSNE